MPHELFGDVAARPSSVRSRRSPLVVASLGAHAAVVAGMVVASIVAPSALPFPTDGITWDQPVSVKMVDIPLPKAPRLRETPRPTPGPTRSPEGAPPTDPVMTPGRIVTESDGPRYGPGDGTPLGPVDVGSVAGLGITTLEPAPVARSRPAAPVRLHAGIRAPRKIVDVAPVYPEIALRTRREGVVILEATIDARGTVQSASVLRSVPLLDQAAIDAVRQWRFEPALLNEQPISVIMTVTVRFALR